LGTVIDVRPLIDDKGHKDSPFGFQVTTRDKALLLFAQTNEERTAWCDVINSKIDHLKRKTSLTLQTLSQPIPVVQFSSSPSTRLYSTHNEPRSIKRSNNNNNNSNNNSIENGSSNSTPALSPRMSDRDARHKLARSHSFDHSKVITFQSPTPLTATISISSDDEIGTRRNSNNLNNNNSINTNNTTTTTTNFRERNNTINVSTVNNNNNNTFNNKLSNSGGGGTSKNGSSFAHARDHSKTHIVSPQTHMRKKSGGRIQEEINEYIKMSIWLQRQETVQKEKEKEKRDSQKEKQDPTTLQKEKENIVVEERVRASM